MSNEILTDKFGMRRELGGGFAQTEIAIGPFPSHAIVLANAYGSTHYRRPAVDAGISLTVSSSGESVEEESVEDDLCVLDFHTSASLRLFLPAGAIWDVAARAKPLGEPRQATSHETKVHLHVVAMQVACWDAVALDQPTSSPPLLMGA